MIYNDESTNNKLLLLFVLEKLEMPISEEILLQICSIDTNWVPYLYCKQVINELIKSGFVTRVSTNANSPIVSITQDGRTCLSHFYNDIPLSKQEEVASFIKENRLNYRKKQEFVADYFRNNDGTFTVSLKILEVAQPLVDIKLVVSNRPTATSIYNAWSSKAPEVYRLLYEQLIDG